MSKTLLITYLGNLIKKVVPLFSSLLNQMVPPCHSTMVFIMTYPGLSSAHHVGHFAAQR
jgi:hypothetical protein